MTTKKSGHSRMLSWIALLALAFISYSTLHAETKRTSSPPATDMRDQISEMERDMVGAFGWERRRIARKPAAALSVGTKRTFWAQEWDGQFYQTSATCRAVGKHAYAFVENEMWNGRVLQRDVNAILDAFDHRTPADPDRGIYSVDVEAFGEPPDVDGDPKIYILILDIKDDGLAPGLAVGGYFSGVNEFSDREARSRGYRSNETELLYVDCNPCDVSSRQAHSIVAHEFQHMIHFNADPQEETWINEGCSTFAEFINGYGVRVPDSFKNDPGNSLVDWDSQIADYEQAGMFVDYLFEHWGGSATIKALVANSAHGVTGVTATLSKRGYSEGFDHVFEDWVIANYLDDERVGDGRYAYKNYDLSGRGRFSDTRVHSSYPASGRNAVAYTAANYIAFTGAENLEADFDGANTNDFDVRVITIKNGAPPQVVEIPLDRWNDGTSTFSDVDWVVLIPIVRKMAFFPVSYSYSVKEAVPELRGIVRVSPRPDASGVPLDARLTVVFSAPYDPGTIHIVFGAYPAGEHTRSEDGKTLTIAPSDTLEPYTRYTLCVKAGVKEPEGNVLLEKDYTWSFTTGAGGEITELAYDDGDYNLHLYWNLDGEGSGVRFTSPYVPAKLVSANFYVSSVDFGNTFLVRMFDDNGTGLPGKERMDPLKVEAPGIGWLNVDLQQKDIEVENDFHIMFQILSDTLNLGPVKAITSSRPYFGAEDHSPTSGRSWDLYFPPFSAQLKYEIKDYDYAIRTVVAPIPASTLTEEQPAVSLPETFSLFQNIPNPFNATTAIPYQITEPGRVSIVLYDLLGQNIRTIVDAMRSAGRHTAHWDGTDKNGNAVASSVYFYRLQYEEKSITKRMMMLR